MVSYPIPHQSYNEEYFFVTFKIVLQNCIWKFSIILQFSKPHISTPYNKIGTTIVSNSSNCIAIGKFNFLASSRLSTWPFLLVVQDVHTLYLWGIPHRILNYRRTVPHNPNHVLVHVCIRYWVTSRDTR